MTTVCDVSSPLYWVGGKYAAAKRILAAFPLASAYGTYVEVFGGAAHVLFAKPQEKHFEVYNDLNGDLVRFWMMARDHAEVLQQRVDSLPYSRTLYYDYRKSLHDNEPMDDLERAARWFYVLRSTFGGHPNFKKGWAYEIRQGSSKVAALRSATTYLTSVVERFRYVQIEHQDFEKIIQVYQTPRTFFYADPPYIDCERYYNISDTALFTREDHTRLAALLNTTSALVALSYYEHPLLDDLYPTSKWRRISWTQPKAIARTRGTRQSGREVLLMNYPASFVGLWHEQDEQEEVS